MKMSTSNKRFPNTPEH